MARITPNFVTNCTWCSTTLSLLFDVPVADAAIERRIIVRLRGQEPYEVFGVESHLTCYVCKGQQTKWLANLPTATKDEVPCCHGIPGTEWCTACEAEV